MADPEEREPDASPFFWPDRLAHIEPDPMYSINEHDDRL